MDRARTAQLRLLFVFLCLLAAMAFLPGGSDRPARAAAPAVDETRQTGPSGLPVPRFVSLKRNVVNMRLGPSRRHRIEWVYRNQAGLPMLVTAEAGMWRKVQDHEGVSGWIHGLMLDGTRTVRVQGAVRTLYARPRRSATAIAQVSPGAIGTVRRCTEDWCELTFDGTRGWMPRAHLWGLLSGEQVD